MTIKEMRDALKLKIGNIGSFIDVWSSGIHITSSTKPLNSICLSDDEAKSLRDILIELYKEA